MNKVVVSFVAGAAVVGAAGFGTMVYPQMRAKQQVDKALAALPPGMQAKYQTLTYSLFSGTLVIGGFEIAVQDSDDTIVTRLASVSLRQIGQDRVGELRGAGLTVDNADRSVHVEAETVAGEGLEAPAGVLVGLNGPAAMTVKRLALNGVSLTAENEKVKLREIVLADYRQTDKFPLSMSLGLHGLVVETQSLPDAEARDGLARLGYDTLSLNFDMTYAHAPDTKRVSIQNLAFSGDGIGRLSLSFDLAGVEVAMLEEPALAMAALQTAMLERLELRYDDDSLAGRLLKLGAEEAELDEAEFKAMLLSNLTADAAPANGLPLVHEAVSSATAFLANPKSLALRVKPTQPLPIYQIINGNPDPATLGMSISANQ